MIYLRWFGVKVKDKLRAIHAVVRGYVSSGCGELNINKCYTFGDDSVQGTLHNEFQHPKDFRIVGGSIVVRENASSLHSSKTKGGLNGEGLFAEYGIYHMVG